MGTNMINRDTLEGSGRLQAWLDKMHCSICKITRSYPLAAKTGGLYCSKCEQPSDAYYNYDYDLQPRKEPLNPAAWIDFGAEAAAEKTKKAEIAGIGAVVETVVETAE